MIISLILSYNLKTSTVYSIILKNTNKQMFREEALENLYWLIFSGFISDSGFVDTLHVKA